jgi:arylformamidase
VYGAPTGGPAIATMEHRVEFDFDIRFSNGGGLTGEGFRLDIEGDDVSDAWVADAIVRELRLLMVESVTITRRRIIAEAHKRPPAAGKAPGSAPADGRRTVRRIDLSHRIEDGLVTYRGLPPPRITDHLSREASRASYAPGTEFQIGRIEMVANTGTYIDSPFHRFADGTDIAGLDLDRLADLPAIVIRATGIRGRSVEGHLIAAALAELDAENAAILVETGWGDAHWGTEAYFEGHPFLTEAAVQALVEARPVLVGVDTYNIDDTADPRRPAHTTLLGAGIPIVEHLCRLGELPLTGARFSAVPAPIHGMGTFPVRAYAVVEGD